MKTLLELIQPIPADDTAIIVPETNLHVSYGTLREQAIALGKTLAAAGVERGDRVGIALPNGLPLVTSFLAAATVGAAAPLNPAYTEDEFRFYLESTGVRALIVPAEGLDAARRAASDRVRLLPIGMSPDGTVAFTGWSGRKAFELPTADDVALVLHTSGSTGRPKRVPLTHANLSLSAEHVACSCELRPEDVALCVMPLFHVHGLVAAMLGTLSTGGTLVAPARFNAHAFWSIARAHSVTWYSAVPTIHQLLLARAHPAAGRPAGAERLRFIRSCSAALRPQLMRDVEHAFGAPVLEAYGMTEAAHQIAANPLPPARRKPGSVGRGTGVAISIMDAAGRHLPIGERGEVVIKGPNVTRGYENNPEANAKAFIDGWFRTGDEGYLDADGDLRLVARIKELINRGGEKISPHEIDEVLLAHPSVAEAVSFGVPHKTWGEEVAAAVVVRETVSESHLLAFCKERLAEFKRPKQIHFTETIPRTATGKIQRDAVAKAFTAIVKTTCAR